MGFYNIVLMSADPKKINCIKAVYQLTKMGLSDSKNLVESCTEDFSPVILLGADRDQCKLAEELFVGNGTIQCKSVTAKDVIETLREESRLLRQQLNNKTPEEVNAAHTIEQLRLEVTSRDRSLRYYQTVIEEMEQGARERQQMYENQEELIERATLRISNDMNTIYQLEQKLRKMEDNLRLQIEITSNLLNQ